MASTTVDSTSDRPLQLDSIPTVDLRLLSQSELYSLSLCSDSAFDLRRCDDVVIPKIDRSVFNESAGSRKQTYSRLRLAPAASSTTIHRRTPHLRSHIPPSNSISSKNDPEQAENSQIINLLKELFKSDSNCNDFVPIEVEYSNPAPDVPNPVTIVGKRKRGRPRKDEKVVPREAKPKGTINNVVKKIVVFDNVEDRDKEIVNNKGVVIDMATLAELEDPYGPEIRRRTVGMATEDQLLGFLKGLNGQWGSRRKKKRVVDASDFGDTLPKGWRLSLSIKKKVGRVWLFCRRYISPSGRQFASCREISAYLLSILGPQNSDKPNCAHNNDEHASKVTSGNAADPVLQEDNKIDTAVCYSSSLVTSLSRNLDKQVMLKIPDAVELGVGEIFECPKCTMNFDGKDDLLQHQLLCHRRKRSKAGTSITDGVIIKDGKYECQFCHKTFNEKHRYNGHIGAHVKYEVKSAEPLSTVSEGKNDHPFLLGGVPDRESLPQASMGADDSIVTETCDVNSNNKLNTDSPHSIYKACSSIETYADKLVDELNFLAHDKQDLQVNSNGNIVAEESSDNLIRSSSDDKVCGTDEVPDVVAAKSDSGVVYEAALSNNENNSNREPSGETHVIDSVDEKTKKCFLEQETSGSCVLSPFPNEQTSGGVVNNVVAGPADVELLNEEAVSEIGFLPSNTSGATDGTGSPNDRDNTYTADEHTLDTDKVTNGESLTGFCNTPAGLDEDGVTMKQHSCFEVHSLVPQGSEEFIEKADGLIPPIRVESELKRGLVSSILIPSGDEDTRGVDRNSNQVCSSLLSPKLDGKHEICSNECRSSAGSDADVTRVEEEKNFENCSAISSWREKVCASENNGNVISTCMVEEPRQQISCESSLLQPVCEPTCCIENNEDKVSSKESEEVKVNEFQTFGNNEAIVHVDGSQSGLNPSVMTIAKERNLEFCSLIPSGNEQTFDLQDDVTGLYDSAMEECKEETSERGLLNQFCIAETSDDVFVNKLYNSPLDELKFDEDRDIGNHELSLAFGNPHAGLYTDTTSMEQKRDLADRSFVPSEIEQTFGVQTNLSMVNSSMVQDLKEGRGSMSDLFSLSCNSGTNAFGNNFNTVYTGREWEERKVEDVGNSVNKTYMIGFGSSPYQPGEDEMPSAMWKTGGGNALQSGLASHPLVQSPSCFRTFDIISDKAEDGLFRLGENYNNGPGVNGFRSGRSEPVEFSFLTAHNSNSLQGNSKDFSYGTEMGQEFNPSFWLGKGALMPNIAANQVTAVCVWCRNEFQHEPGHSGIQAGIGSMCPTCSARISQQVNIL